MSIVPDNPLLGLFFGDQPPLDTVAVQTGKATMPTTKHVGIFYNLHEGNRQYQQDLDALLSLNPLVLGYCEAWGDTIHPRPGYTSVRASFGSRPGRMNVGAYVQKSPQFPVGPQHWMDLHSTWPNAQHPGTHWPRSILHFRLGVMQIVIHHQPQRFIHGYGELKSQQQEGIDGCLKIMTPRNTSPAAVKRPRLLLGDMNASASTPSPSPKDIATALHGTVIGGDIDTGVARNIRVENVHYPQEVNGHKLNSDHKHALVFDFILEG